MAVGTPMAGVVSLLGGCLFAKVFHPALALIKKKGLKLLAAVGGVLFVEVKLRSGILIDSPGFLFKVVWEYFNYGSSE